MLPRWLVPNKPTINHIGHINSFTVKVENDLQVGAPKYL
jgi:hypothetical protein